MVDKVRSGINGDIFKYRWRHSREDVEVAVKKIRNSTLQDSEGTETNERLAHMRGTRTKCPPLEDALTEIGILTYLSKQADLPIYFLKMLATYEDNHFTWIVTEFAEGGELFKFTHMGNRLPQSKLKEMMWQLLQAVEYLHRHRIGHRDISLENALLKDDVVRLIDFGMAVVSHSSAGTPLRYFRPASKEHYRAPECFVPARSDIEVTAPLDSAPNDIVMIRTENDILLEVRLPTDVAPGKSCTADVWGYAICPADVFALGICMFNLAFQASPWEFAKLTEPLFAQMYHKGFESMMEQMTHLHCLDADAMSVLSAMLQVSPAKRPSVDECLACPWFETMRGRAVHSSHSESMKY
jgi:serine/threonine protein kinase